MLKSKGNSEFNLFIEVRKIGLEGIREKLESVTLAELKHIYKENGFIISKLNGKITRENIIRFLMNFITNIKKLNDSVYENYGEGVRKQLMQIYD